MRSLVRSCVTSAAVALTACHQAVNTMPPVLTPAADVQRLDLELPPDLDVRGIDFAPTTYADVRGTPDVGTSSRVAGRAFVKVWAVHRRTGEQYLVLYEDIAHRRRPTQIIHFAPGRERASPDSTS